MSARFTFKISDLIAGLTRSHQWEWYGPCKADILIEHTGAELRVVPISECNLSTPHLISKFESQPAAAELEKELSAAQTNGNGDAMILTSLPEYRGDLAVTIGLRPQKYELFRTFVMLHFGRPDLSCRMSCIFAGFAASPSGGLVIPNEADFRKGRPYFVVDDISIRFSASQVSS